MYVNHENCEDIFAKVARQFVWRYLSCIRVTFNWIIWMIIAISKPPKLSSFGDRCVNLKWIWIQDSFVFLYCL